ncbi:hypothetical protein HLB23_00130 [Nocardia uniformis]|uniref:Uncharacterized protein n=1 Tax=Nocardia uniformis TaxID=53432 RepID=A0A849BNZ3_9NOCA|nr:YtxH domain-containing protein [Nocardia uniformis]NNH68303.1 hypothetical protein [Nocardia uniformis]
MALQLTLEGMVKQVSSGPGAPEGIAADPSLLATGVVGAAIALLAAWTTGRLDTTRDRIVDLVVDSLENLTRRAQHPR